MPCRPMSTKHLFYIVQLEVTYDGFDLLHVMSVGVDFALGWLVVEIIPAFDHIGDRFGNHRFPTHVTPFDFA